MLVPCAGSGAGAAGAEAGGCCGGGCCCEAPMCMPPSIIAAEARPGEMALSAPRCATGTSSLDDMAPHAGLVASRRNVLDQRCCDGCCARSRRRQARREGAAVLRRERRSPGGVLRRTAAPPSQGPWKGHETQGSSKEHRMLRGTTRQFGENGPFRNVVRYIFGGDPRGAPPDAGIFGGTSEGGDLGRVGGDLLRGYSTVRGGRGFTLGWSHWELGAKV